MSGGHPSHGVRTAYHTYPAREDHEKLHFKVRTAHDELTTQGTSLGDFPHDCGCCPL